jgi:peptidoglycan-N-acetylglucosamine deacetylase
MQVFLDTTGKRSRKVNWLLGIVLVVFSSLIAFVTVHTLRLHLIELHAQSPSIQNQDRRADSAAMFYTDNHAHAYPTLQDQIGSIDSLIIPTYTVTQSKVITPPSYKELHEDIDFLTVVKSANYDRYHHMSTKGYTNLPLDRSSENVTLPHPQFLKATELTAIRESLLEAGARGLIVEIDSQLLLGNQLNADTIQWFNGIRKLLHEKRLELGVHLTLDKVANNTAELMQLSDIVYVSFSQKEPITPQLEQLSRIEEFLPDNAILELPTVSSDTNMLNRYDYVKNIGYSSVAPILLEHRLKERTVEPAQLIHDDRLYRIFDAVSAYNLMRSVKERAISTELQFSIGSPGYEEYTLWSLLANSLEPADQQQIIQSKVMNNRGIEQVGHGEVYQLEQAGSFGGRSITIDKQTNMITASTKEKNNSPARISRSGHKANMAALTFDDGPHPIYTRKIMNILEEHGVRGTFFVVGDKVAAHPDVARDIVRRGHQIENHTYTHAAVSQMSEESAVAEITATSQMIELITGQSVQYFRRPYSGSDTFNTWDDVAYLQLLEELGLQASEYDVDSKDWELSSTDAILQKVKSDIAKLPDGAFSQVLFHDSHDNPELTLNALPLIIEHLQNGDISLVRVDELTDATSDAVQLSTTFAALTSRGILIQGFVFLNVAFIGFSVTKYAWMIIGSVVYAIERRRSRRRQSTAKPRSRLRTPTLAIIISCYNEEKVIGKTIRSLLNSSYQKFRVIIINDGSTDFTSRVVKYYAKKDSRINLITTPNRGKSHALNLAISHVTNEWLVFCDADTVFANNALEKYVHSLNSTQNLGAVAGRIRVGNDYNPLTRAQVIEYGIANTLIKPAQDIINSITVVPGACGLWNRKSLIAAGGFSPDTLAEDADSTMKIISMRKQVLYENNITAETEAPDTISALYKQRTRWQLGNMQALFKHHSGVFNSQYGALGYIGLPMFYIEILHVLFFPVLLLFSAANLSVILFQLDTIMPTNVGLVSSQVLLWISLGVIVYDILLSIFVITRERKSWKQKMHLLATLPYYYYFYRFFLSYSTLVALLRALRGRLHGWGHLKRSATVRYQEVTSQ